MHAVSAVRGESRRGGKSRRGDRQAPAGLQVGARTPCCRRLVADGADLGAARQAGIGLVDLVHQQQRDVELIVLCGLRAAEVIPG